MSGNDRADGPKIAVVVIGRNEGTRLQRCLDCLARERAYVVYVDSGSTDGSVSMAKASGVDVLELDQNAPFTAPRARNEGFQYAQVKEEWDYVQFIDGDCALVEGWLSIAASALNERADVALVCGRLRERNPESSVYNRLCDMEWNASLGEIGASGGIFVIRQEAFEPVGGFNTSLIAGEEPELCVRLRQAGWKLLRMDRPMAWHDANISRFVQWWQRNVRAGHGYAEGYCLHGRGPMRHYAKQYWSNWLWALIAPLLIGSIAWLIDSQSLLLLAVYLVQAMKIARYRVRNFQDPWRHACLYGLFVVMGKVPNMLGQSRYWLNRLCGVQAKWIDYKTQSQSASIT